MLNKRQANRISIALLIKSASLGAKTGLILSSLYTCGFWMLITAKLIGDPIVQKELPFPLDQTIQATLGGGFFILLIGGILGIVPSLLVGALTAIFILVVLWFGKARMSAPIAILIGVGVAFFVAKFLEVMLWPQVPNPSIGSLLDLAYYIWRWPRYIYVVSSGWLGWRLWQFIAGNAGVFVASSEAYQI